jgi:uncharacterized lipoprotein YbaY
VSVPFEVTYNPDGVEDNHLHSVAVHIEDGAGNLLFIRDTVIPVIT